MDVLLFLQNVNIKLIIFNIINQPIITLILAIIFAFIFRRVVITDMKDVVKLLHSKFDKLEEKVVLIKEDIFNLKNTMVSYKIMNQEVMCDDVEDISMIIRMSAESISNICVQYTIGKRDGYKNTFDINELMKLITDDVQKDRENFHISLVEKGLNPKAIKVWEETEKIMFPKFAIYCRDFATSYIKLSGNGELNNLIKTQGKLLADRLYSEFMSTLKSKIIER